MVRSRILLLCAGLLITQGHIADAAPARGRKADKPAAPESATPSAPAVPPPADTRPYDPQLMRLAEILGALTTMRQICGAPDTDQWRQRMQALLDAEGGSTSRKERLAGAYNRGLRGYGLSYRTCTSNARLVIRRFLEESSRLARDVTARYRAS